MSLKVVDLGLYNLIVLLQNAFPAFTVKLFQNNHTPAAADTAGSYTEATFSGYAAATVAAGAAGWPSTPLYDPANHRYQLSGTTCSYTGNGGGTTNSIYGYFVVDASNNLYWAELLAGGPFTLGAAGSNISVIPTLTDKSEF